MIWAKTKKTSRKPKKPKKRQNSTDYVGPRASHRAIVSKVLFFFVFFGFLEVFDDFGQKPKKPRENQKNQKNQNSTDYVGPRASHRAIVSKVLFFFCFFWISRGF